MNWIRSMINKYIRSVIITMKYYTISLFYLNSLLFTIYLNQYNQYQYNNNKIFIFLLLVWFEDVVVVELVVVIVDFELDFVVELIDVVVEVELVVVE